MLINKLPILPTGPEAINDITLVGLMLGLLLVIISAVGLAIRAFLALRLQARLESRSQKGRRFD
jgi:hypothetical protein